MKIAVVVGAFPVLSETFIVNQIIYLIDAGHDVTICSYNEGKRAVIHDSVEKYNLLDKCVYYKQPSASFFKRLSDAFSIMIKLRDRLDWQVLLRSLNFFKFGRKALSLRLLFQSQWLLEKDFDIVHVHFGTQARALAYLGSRGIITTPLVVSFHGYDLPPAKIDLYKGRFKHLFEYCKKFTVNSEYTLQLLRKIYSGNNVVLMPVPLDTKSFQRSDSNTHKGIDSFVIIYCGRLLKFKGSDIAVNIINQLVHGHNSKQVELRIIGDGSMKDELSHMILEYGLTENVKLLGALKQEEIKREMERAHLFISPGITEPETLRAENQGLVIQEAQSMGLPVIVSSAGGMKYGMQDGVTGFVVNEGDVDGFVAKIIQLQTDEKLRVDMGEKAREYVVKNFDVNNLGARLEELYNSVLAQ
jgi:colanic acid/amylovoran biosynthesis glycosyltransferase